MPASYHIDVSRQLVRSRAWGELTNEEMRDYYHRLIVDPRFSPSFRQLTCLDAVTAFTVNGWMIAEVSSWPVFDAGTRRAIVAGTDIAFGMARMFSLHAERVGQVVRVFRDAAEAEAWIASPVQPGDRTDIARPGLLEARHGAAA